MSNASKIILGLLLANIMAIALVVLIYRFNHPYFLEGRNNTMLFSHGQTYTDEVIESYQKLFTVDHRWDGFHDLHSTIQMAGNDRSLNLYYSVFFWGQDLFSARDTVRSPNYVTLAESDFTEAHLIDDSAEQFFQILYQDRYNFCYVSLLTSSVQCITADQ
ncbi:hypothetical protein [Vibrio sp. CAU 1672]|uniref:hypothetical protein n=1 Tax=Vibrio sp. CAU 1672 TaxID=3032594 RepID=UPI0023D99727|nr:hypothetical protein [Vibrio sp. CAU 1672]MDF2152824.1 hypothetical protein [Vibrio sp. CAU 1672]